MSKKFHSSRGGRYTRSRRAWGRLMRGLRRRGRGLYRRINRRRR